MTYTPLILLRFCGEFGFDSRGKRKRLKAKGNEWSGCLAKTFACPSGGKTSALGQSFNLHLYASHIALSHLEEILSLGRNWARLCSQSDISYGTCIKHPGMDCIRSPRTSLLTAPNLSPLFLLWSLFESSSGSYSGPGT